jgi:hypothetical protein
MMNEIVWSADPRPDLHIDSAMWATILTKVFAVDGHEPGGLFGTLHGGGAVGRRNFVPKTFWFCPRLPLPPVPHGSRPSVELSTQCDRKCKVFR